MGLNGSERLLVQHGLVVYGCLNGSESISAASSGIWINSASIRAAWPSGIWMPKWK